MNNNIVSTYWLYSWVNGYGLIIKIQLIGYKKL